MLLPENDNVKKDIVDEEVLPRNGAVAASRRVELPHGEMLRTSVRTMARHKAVVALVMHGRARPDDGQADSALGKRFGEALYARARVSAGVGIR